MAAAPLSRMEALERENECLRARLEATSQQLGSTRSSLSHQLSLITSSLHRFKAEASPLPSNSTTNPNSAENPAKNEISNPRALPFSTKAEAVQPRGALDRRQSDLSQAFAAFAKDFHATVDSYASELSDLQATAAKQASHISCLENSLTSSQRFTHKIQASAAAAARETQMVRLELRASQEAAEKLRYHAEDLERRVVSREQGEEKGAAEAQRLRQRVRELVRRCEEAQRRHLREVGQLSSARVKLQEEVHEAERLRLAQVSSRLFFEKQAAVLAAVKDKSDHLARRLKEEVAVLREEVFALRREREKWVVGMKGVFGKVKVREEVKEVKEKVREEMRAMAAFMEGKREVFARKNWNLKHKKQLNRLGEELRLTKGIHAEELKKQALERKQAHKEILALKNALYKLQREASGREDNTAGQRFDPSSKEEQSSIEQQLKESKERVAVLEYEKPALVEAMTCAVKREELAKEALKELKQVNEGLREQFASLSKRDHQKEEKKMEKLVLEKMEELKAAHVEEQKRMQKQIEELAASLDRVAAERDALATQTAKMEKAHGEVKAERDQINSQLEKAQNSLQTASNASRENLASQAKAQEEVSLLSQKLEKTCQEKTALKASLAGLQEEAKSLESQLESREVDFSTRFEEANMLHRLEQQKHHKQMESISQERDEFKAVVEAQGKQLQSHGGLVADLTKAHALNRHLEQQAAKLQQENSVTKSHYEELLRLQESARKKQAARLREAAEKAEESQCRYESAAKAKEELQSSLDNLKRKFESQEESLQQSVVQSSTLASSVTKLQEELTHLQMQEKQKIENLSETHAEERQILATRVESLQRTLERLTSERDTLRVQFDSQQNQQRLADERVLGELNQQRARVESLQLELKKTCEDAAIERSKVAAHYESCQASREAKLAAALEEVKLRLQEATHKRDRLEADLEGHQEKIHCLSGELAKAQRQSSMLSDEKGRKEEEMQAKMEELNRLHVTEQQRLENEANHWKKQAQGLAKELASLKQSQAAKVEENGNIARELEEARGALTSLQGSIEADKLSLKTHYEGMITERENEHLSEKERLMKSLEKNTQEEQEKHVLTSTKLAEVQRQKSSLETAWSQLQEDYAHLQKQHQEDKQRSLEENRRISRELEEARASLSSLQSSIVADKMASKAHYEDLLAKCEKEHFSEKERLMKALEELEKRAGEEQEKHMVASTELAEMQQQKFALETALSQLQEDYIHLQKQDQEDEQNSLEENRRMSRELDEARASFASLQSSIEADQVASNAHYEDLLAKREKEHCSEKESVMKTLEELEKRAKEEHEKHMVTSTELAEMQQQKSALETALSQLQEDYIHLKTHSQKQVEEAVAASEERQRMHTAEQQEASKRLEESTYALQQLTEERDALKTEASQQESRLLRYKSLEADHNQACSLIQSLEARVAELEAERSSLSAGYEGKLEESLMKAGQLLKEREKMEVRIKSVTSARDKLQQEHQKLQEKLLLQSGELTEIKQQLHSHQEERKELEEALKVSQTRNEVSLEERDELKRRLHDQEHQLEHLERVTAEASEARALAHSLEGRLLKAEEDHAALEAKHEQRLSSRSEEVKKLVEEMSTLQSQLSSTTKARDEGCMELQVLEEKLVKQSRDLEDAVQQKESLTSTLSHLQEDYVLLQKEAKTKEVELQSSHEEQHKHLRQELAASSETVSGLEERLKELQSQQRTVLSEIRMKHRSEVCSLRMRMEDASASLTRSKEQQEQLQKKLQGCLLQLQKEQKLAASRLLQSRIFLHWSSQSWEAQRRTIQRLALKLLRASTQEAGSVLNQRAEVAEMAIEDRRGMAERDKERVEAEADELRSSVAMLHEALQQSEEAKNQKEVELARVEDTALEAQGKFTALEHAYKQLQQTTKSTTNALLAQTVSLQSKLDQGREGARAKQIVKAQVDQVVTNLGSVESEWRQVVSSMEQKIIALENRLVSYQKRDFKRAKQEIKATITNAGGGWIALLEKMEIKLQQLDEKVKTLLPQRCRLLVYLVQNSQQMAEVKRHVEEQVVGILSKFDSMVLKVLPEVERQSNVLVQCERQLSMLPLSTAAATCEQEQLCTMSNALRKDLNLMEQLSQEERSSRIVDEVNTLKGRLDLVMEEKSRVEALFALEKRKLEQEVSAWKREATDVRADYHRAASYQFSPTQASLQFSAQCLPLTRQLQNFQSPSSASQLRQKTAGISKAAFTEPRVSATASSLRQQKEDAAKMLTIRALATAARKEKAAEEELKSSIVVWQDLINAAKQDSPEREKSQYGSAVSSPQSPLGADHYLLSSDNNLGKKRVALKGRPGADAYRIGSSARALYFFLALQKILNRRQTKQMRQAFASLRGAPYTANLEDM